MKRKPKDPHKIGWTSDKSKIKFYTENKTDHKQKVICGVRPDGTHYEIICDWAIIDLIRDLNNMGVRTTWSCQGNALGTPVAYVVINPSKLSKSKLMWADDFIRDYWKDRYISVDVCRGEIAYYAYTAQQLQRLPKNQLLRTRKDD